MNEIMLPYRPESGNNLDIILEHIRKDICRYEDLHGEPPGMVFLSNILYEALTHHLRRAVCYESRELVTDGMIFGLPATRYTPRPMDGPMAVGYYLATPERKFTFREE